MHSSAHNITSSRTPPPSELSTILMFEPLCRRARKTQLIVHVHTNLSNSSLAGASAAGPKFMARFAMQPKASSALPVATKSWFGHFLKM